MPRTMPMVLAAALLLASQLGAHALDFPTRPVSIIQQTGAGSAGDVVGRILANRLGALWGQQVVTINRPGAGGAIAVQAAMNANPDGHTLFMAGTSALTILPHVNKTFTDVNDKFAAIALVGEQPMIVAAAPQLGVRRIDELIKRANERPSEIFYAANSRGSLPNLTGELFNRQAGTRMTFIPYQGGVASAMTDILSGRTSIVFEGLAGVSSAIDSQSLIPLAVASATRLPNRKDIPTVAETIAGFESTGWFTLVAPKGTPDEIVRKINLDLMQVLAEPEIVEKFEALGTYIRRMTPEDTRRFIRAELVKWGPLASELNMTNER